MRDAISKELDFSQPHTERMCILFVDGPMLRNLTNQAYFALESEAALQKDIILEEGGGTVVSISKEMPQNEPVQAPFKRISFG
jgi:hypothetical protein